MPELAVQSEDGTRLLSRGQLSVWRMVQVAVWLVGVAILVALVAAPAVGLHAFWNVLIPVAPALLAVAPGLWRNICPLGSTALLSRHTGLSRRRRLSLEWQGRLSLIGVTALLLIVPLRHVVLDLNGPATALTLVVLTSIAVVMGLSFEWKSGWCSGACPVHPVEQLYGSAPLLQIPNAHCGPCQRCVSPCPDSTPSLHPLAARKPRTRRVAGTLFVGGFAGFIWGWFQVPDRGWSDGLKHLDSAYGLPFAGLAVTLSVFLVLRRVVPADRQERLIRCFAAAAIACYYWYRLPALFGFGPFPGDGMLVDLRHVLPAWFPIASRSATTVLFVWWLVGRTTVQRSWGVRPEVAPELLANGGGKTRTG